MSGSPSTVHELALTHAVARSFIYRLLAKAYETPSEEAWWWLANSSVEKVFWSSVRVIAPDETHPLQQEAEELVPQLTAKGYPVFAEAWLRNLSEIARCSGYDEGMAARQGRLKDLADLYQVHDFEISNVEVFQIDSVSLQLEFMAHLLVREVEAIQRNNSTAITDSRNAQKRIVQNHLSKWLDALGESLKNAKDLGPIDALAGFTKAFVIGECARFGALKTKPRSNNDAFGSQLS